MSSSGRAIYAGTFDPVTYGHLDIIERVVRLFPELVVAVVDYPEHKQPLFDSDKRVDMIKNCLPPESSVEVLAFKGLLADFARTRRIKTLVRGLRAVSDFDTELMLTLVNRTQNRELETVFLMPSYRYFYLTSSIVREVAKLHGKLDNFVHPYVATKLRAKFGLVEEEQL